MLRSQSLFRELGQGIRSSASGFWDAALSLIYPSVCQVCGEASATAAQSFICPTCRGKVKFINPPICLRCGFPFHGAITTAFECANCREVDLGFSKARSAVVAKEVILEVIHRYKYHRAFWFEPFLGELLVGGAAPDLAESTWDCIVPVPLHPVKQREREFNQAERLARRLSAATGIPLQTKLLRRTIFTRTQTLLSREERLQNVRKAFAMRKGVQIEGRRIVLVDDVFTTGATTDACARVLRSAGAADVCVWTVARGI